MSVIVAFGEDGGYFVKTARKSIWWGLPKELSTELKGGFQKKHFVCLGPDETYFMACRTKDGEDRILYNFRGHYDRLENWLTTKNHNISTIKVALGPNGSYWAASDKSWSWGSLSDEIHEKLQELKAASSKIKSVTLGVDKSYVILHGNNGASWNLKGKYPYFQERLTARKADKNQAKQMGPIAYVSLSPHTARYFFAAFDLGETCWELPDKWHDKIQELMAAHAEDRSSTGGYKSGGTRSGSGSSTSASSSYASSASTTHSSSSGEKKENILVRRKDEIDTAVKVGQFIVTAGACSVM